MVVVIDRLKQKRFSYKPTSSVQLLKDYDITVCEKLKAKCQRIQNNNTNSSKKLTIRSDFRNK